MGDPVTAKPVPEIEISSDEGETDGRVVLSVLIFYLFLTATQIEKLELIYVFSIYVSVKHPFS
jgi:hypothetical protein